MQNYRKKLVNDREEVGFMKKVGLKVVGKCK